MIAHLLRNEVMSARVKQCKLVVLAFVTMVLGTCLLPSSASAGCGWLHHDGWYNRVHQSQRVLENGLSWDVSERQGSDSRPGELALVYSDGQLRFRLNFPSKPCNGPNCRSGSPLDSSSPVSFEQNRSPVFGTVSGVVEDFYPVPRCDWNMLSDSVALSSNCEPATPPPRLA